MVRTYRGAAFNVGDVCTLDKMTNPRKVVVRKVTRGGRDIHIEHDEWPGLKEIVHASRLSWGYKP
jgi:hypothetical protein